MGQGRVIGGSFTPVQTAGLSNIIAISAGWDQALALRSDHTVWVWGRNGVGELGDGTTNNRPIPVQVTSLSNIVAVSGGDWHSSALDSDGTVWNGPKRVGNSATEPLMGPAITSRIHSRKKSNSITIAELSVTLSWSRPGIGITSR